MLHAIHDRRGDPDPARACRASTSTTTGAPCSTGSPTRTSATPWRATASTAPTGSRSSSCPSSGDQLARGGDISVAVTAVAAWARYLEGVDEQGRPIDVVDRRRSQLAPLARGSARDPGRPARPPRRVRRPRRPAAVRRRLPRRARRAARARRTRDRRGAPRLAMDSDVRASACTRVRGSEKRFRGNVFQKSD